MSRADSNGPSGLGPACIQYTNRDGSRLFPDRTARPCRLITVRFYQSACLGDGLLPPEHPVFTFGSTPLNRGEAPTSVVRALVPLDSVPLPGFKPGTGAFRGRRSVVELEELDRTAAWSPRASRRSPRSCTGRTVRRSFDTAPELAPRAPGLVTWGGRESNPRGLQRDVSPCRPYLCRSLPRLGSPARGAEGGLRTPAWPTRLLHKRPFWPLRAPLRDLAASPGEESNLLASPDPRSAAVAMDCPPWMDDTRGRVLTRVSYRSRCPSLRAVASTAGLRFLTSPRAGRRLSGVAADPIRSSQCCHPLGGRGSGQPLRDLSRIAFRPAIFPRAGSGFVALGLSGCPARDQR